MVLKIFSVYDSKVEAYTIPQFFDSTGRALRALMNELDQPQSAMAKYPADFTLFEIGEYDDKKCEIKMYEAKINLGCALEFSTRKAALGQGDQGGLRDDRENPLQVVKT